MEGLQSMGAQRAERALGYTGMNWEAVGGARRQCPHHVTGGEGGGAHCMSSRRLSSVSANWRSRAGSRVGSASSSASSASPGVMPINRFALWESAGGGLSARIGTPRLVPPTLPVDVPEILQLPGDFRFLPGLKLAKAAPLSLFRQELRARALCRRWAGPKRWAGPALKGQRHRNRTRGRRGQKWAKMGKWPQNDPGGGALTEFLLHVGGHGNPEGL